MRIWPLLLLLPLRALAADPQPYTVTLTPTGQEAVDAALTSSASLISLREIAPADPFAVISRARYDTARLLIAARSFGYYAAQPRIRIAGRDLTDPTLPALLDGTQGSVAIMIGVALGPIYHLRHIALRQTGSYAIPPAAGAALGLQQGDPAIATTVLDATSRMLGALKRGGHALATVSAPIATIIDSDRALDVTYTIDAGPRVEIGPVSVEGLTQVDPAFIQRRLLVHADEQYDPVQIEKARQDLIALGVFATVRVSAAERLGPDGRLPLLFEVTERKRHAVGVTAAFSTDLGGSAGVTFQHRNLFGQAERLDLGAAITQIGGTASKGIGYNATATLAKPDFYARNQVLNLSAQVIKESLQAYDRTAALVGTALARKFGDRWTGSAGLQAQQSQITQERVKRDYTLLSAPISVGYDGIGAAATLDPVQGVKAQASVAPTIDLGARGGQFTVLQVGGSAYIDLVSPGQTVLALRALGGQVAGADALRLPPDQRLYAGGGGTVRGYRYQSIGPRFASGRPVGGTSLLAGTVELRQRFGNYGAAAFVDAGRVGGGSNTSRSNGLKVGVGVGARYYTAIGPIRVDVALPLNKEHGDDAFEAYIGIGQAF